MLRILLVDDEPLVLIGLQGMLEWEKLGYTVCGTARNGKLALELIEREKPDIVIADVKMPVMDGLTLARTCRERGPLPAFRNSITSNRPWGPGWSITLSSWT
jgi:two-component system response regulator YesN